MNLTQKISQMTPKGSDLQATDLVEVSTLVGGSYVTKSVTGQDIIDAAAGSGVTAVTGTSPIVSTGGTTPDISIRQSSSVDDGYLSASDWNTFNGKQAALVSGTNIKTIEGQSLLGAGNINLTATDVGLGNVDNTSDLNKPVSTATQTALNAKQNTLTLTTTGTSGAATLVGATLNIPQYSGGGSSNPKAIAVSPFDGTNVSSTIATISRSILIPANTFDTNCIIEVVWGAVRISGTSAGGQSALYINTSNSLSGATLVATGSNINSTQFYCKNGRDIQKIGTAAKSMNTLPFASDYSPSTAINNFTLNNSTDLYFLFTIFAGVADVVTIRNVRITQYS